MRTGRGLHGEELEAVRARRCGVFDNGGAEFAGGGEFADCFVVIEESDGAAGGLLQVEDLDAGVLRYRGRRIGRRG